jgi:YD repeat-containing protein
MRKVSAAILIAGGMTSLGAQAAETITYQYDELGRLKAVVRTGTVNNNVQVQYTLDAAGNRVTKVVTKP